MLVMKLPDQTLNVHFDILYLLKPSSCLRKRVLLAQRFLCISMLNRANIKVSLS